MKAKNEDAFKALIKKYNSITLKQIKDNAIQDDCDKFESCVTLNEITGFGYQCSCTLCIATKNKNILSIKDAVHCNLCVYGILSNIKYNACLSDNNSDTYEALKMAKDETTLLLAIKERVKHMKKVWKKYQKQIDL
jgi:hypothetical protein